MLVKDFESRRTLVHAGYFLVTGVTLFGVGAALYGLPPVAGRLHFNWGALYMVVAVALVVGGLRPRWLWLHRVLSVALPAMFLVRAVDGFAAWDRAGTASGFHSLFVAFVTGWLVPTVLWREPISIGDYLMLRRRIDDLESDSNLLREKFGDPSSQR